jgi:hypothetical protein
VCEKKITGRTAWTLENISVSWMDQNNRERHNSYCSQDVIHDVYQINQHHRQIACVMKGTFKNTKILMGNSEEKVLLWLPQG